METVFKPRFLIFTNMTESNIYIFLTTSSEYKPAVVCKKCSETTIVNVLEMPVIPHIIKADNDSDAFGVMEKMSKEYCFKGKSTVKNFLESCKIETFNLQVNPDQVTLVDEPKLSKEEQLESMAKYLRDNNYEVINKK